MCVCGLCVMCPCVRVTNIHRTPLFWWYVNVCVRACFRARAFALSTTREESIGTAVTESADPPLTFAPEGLLKSGELPREMRRVKDKTSRKNVKTKIQTQTSNADAS